MELIINHHRIQYEKFGEGPERLFCLHGYGEDGKSFAPLAPALSKRYTLFCPDLPLHGDTQYSSDDFGPADLHQWFQDMSEQEGFGEGPFSLAGYSMGGRLALAYAEQYPQHLNLLVLLAPDGLRRNPWYWLSTHTRTGRLLLKHAMENPRPLFFLMTLAGKLHLLHPKRYHFVMQALADPSLRKSLYHRWTLFRKFSPVWKKLSSDLQVLLFLGEKDTIIPPANARELTKEKYPPVSVQVLPGAGHLLLQNRYIPDIAALILSKAP